MNRDERRKATKEFSQALPRKKPIKIESGPGTGLKRVGRRLPGVNIGSVQSRAGVPLGEQVDEVMRQVASQPQEDMAGHVPTIAALSVPDNGWGVFCMRCSAEASEYIYPCTIDPTDWPPKVLVPLPQPDVD